jgi:monoamine oxidase
MVKTVLTLLLHVGVRVTIIGAGPAGLLAASCLRVRLFSAHCRVRLHILPISDKLQEHGAFDVVLLEAKSRYGGRVHTGTATYRLLLSSAL